MNRYRRMITRFVAGYLCKLVGVFLLLFACNTSVMFAQSFILPLWEDAIPYNYPSPDTQWAEHTTDGITLIRNVHEPEIEVFLPVPRYANGSAVLICPGGGYHVLAYDLEGVDIARFFNTKGIAAIVLKYRLPVNFPDSVSRHIPLTDARRAMRLIRKNAEKWHINPGQVGVMGFSAGGHLASTLSTHYDRGDSISSDPLERFSCRPDFSLLIYPVISFDDKIGHTGSKIALLTNRFDDPEMVDYYSNDKQVTEDTPPAILVHAGNDDTVPVTNSILYYQALQRLGITAEIHIYPYGEHGFGLAPDRGYLSQWPEECVQFIHFLFED